MFQFNSSFLLKSCFCCCIIKCHQICSRLIELEYLLLAELAYGYCYPRSSCWYAGITLLYCPTPAICCLVMIWLSFFPLRSYKDMISFFLSSLTLHLFENANCLKLLGWEKQTTAVKHCISHCTSVSMKLPLIIHYKHQGFIVNILQKCCCFFILKFHKYGIENILQLSALNSRSTLRFQ